MAFQLPSGRVFLFVSNRTVLIDPKTEAVSSPIPDLTVTHRPWIYPYTPTMVLLPLTRLNAYTAELLLCGGSEMNGLASRQCWKVKPDVRGATWVREQDMPIGRLMPDSALMPGMSQFYK